MNADTPDAAAQAGVSLRLGPRHSAPRAARKLAYDLCQQAGSTVLVDNAALVAGELVRTSIHQTRAAVTLQLTCEPGQVTLRVRDGGSGSPIRDDKTDAGAVRCWDIVRRLAVTWGFAEQQSGREMWATLRDERQRLARIAA